MATQATRAAKPNNIATGIHAGLAVGEVFAAVESEMIVNRKAIFQSALQGGSNGFKTNVFARLNEYRAANKKTAETALDKVKQLTAAELLAAYKAGTETVDKAVEHYEKQGYTPTRQPDKKNTLATAALFGAAASLISQFTQILSYADNAATKQLIGVTAQVNAAAPDLAAEIDRAQFAYLKKGLPGKSIATGAEKEMTAEAEFLTRNASHQALMDGNNIRSSEYGLNLILISSHPSSCPLCTPWQGAILVNDLAGGKPDGEHELLSTAIAAGLMHYNCRHTYVNFVPGLDNPDLFKRDQASPKETATRYAIEQEQRHNERMIREYKRQAAGLLDENKVKQANYKIAEWQARQRELREIAERHGVPFYRQYSREQIGGEIMPGGEIKPGGETKPTIKQEVFDYIKQNNITLPNAPKSDILDNDLRSHNSYERAKANGNISGKVKYKDWYNTEVRLKNEVEGIDTAAGVKAQLTTHLTERVIGNTDTVKTGGDIRRPVSVEEVKSILTEPLSIEEAKKIKGDVRFKLQGEDAYIIISETGKIVSVVPRGIKK